MIRLNLMAGMGNQMFEYAYARALSLQYHEKLEINPYFMTLAGLGAGRKRYFNNVLSYLNLPEEITFMNKGKGYLCGRHMKVRVQGSEKGTEIPAGAPVMVVGMEGFKPVVAQV